MLASRQTIRYLTLQRTALKQAGCKRIDEEKVSGATRDRPALTRMLDQLREGDVVVVARLDRLARSTRDLLENAEVLEEGGTRLRSLGGPWGDTASPAWRAPGATCWRPRRSGRGAARPCAAGVSGGLIHPRRPARWC